MRIGFLGIGNMGSDLAAVCSPQVALSRPIRGALGPDGLLHGARPDYLACQFTPTDISNT